MALRDPILLLLLMEYAHYITNNFFKTQLKGYLSLYHFYIF